MLDIPSSLMEKLQQKIQTIGTNSNPRMDVIAQRAAKYLNQGSFLYPRTVRTGTSLGPLDVCIRRENFNEEPTEIVMVYIENGIAKVATLPYVHSPDQLFKWQYDIGPADEVACDFDGRWNLITDRTGIYFDTETIWALQTFGEPYIVLVKSGVMKLYSGETFVQNLCDADVVKCSILRGWKSVSAVLTDQGMICAYTKTDGKAYYRNYCEQENGSFIWEYEKEITEFAPTVTNIALFRCADYRTGFLAEIGGNIQLMVTSRSWSGMAVLPEYVTSKVVNATVEVIDINYPNAESTDEYVTASVESKVLSFGDTLAEMRDAWNYDDGLGDYGRFVVVRFTDSIDNIETNLSSFIMKDAYNVSYYPSAIYKTGYGNRLLLEFVDFNNAANPITIQYTAGSLKWKDDAAVSSDAIEFNAVGLIPTFVPAPVVTNISNTDNQTIIVEFDRPIITIEENIGLTVSGFEPFTSPNGELIASTYAIDSINNVQDIMSSDADMSSGTLENTQNIGGSILLQEVTP